MLEDKGEIVNHLHLFGIWANCIDESSLKRTRNQ